MTTTRTSPTSASTPATWQTDIVRYLAEFPIGAKAGTYTNPLTDDHWVDALAIIVFWFTRAGDTFGLGRWWGEKVGDSWLR